MSGLAGSLEPCQKKSEPINLYPAAAELSRLGLKSPRNKAPLQLFALFDGQSAAEAGAATYGLGGVGSCGRDHAAGEAKLRQTFEWH